MRRIVQAVIAGTVSLAALLSLAGPAGAHEVTDFTVSCPTVSATIADTETPEPNDHPVTWNVSVGGGGFQAVPTTETPVGGADEEVNLVTGDISALTAALRGETVTVQAFASWPSSAVGTETYSGTVTCGTSDPGAPPGDPDDVVQSPESLATPSAPVPVVAVARFTG